jgi:hypothetical protein
MHVATFRFYGELNDFLPPRYRQVSFPHPIQPGGSVKDAIEALGVPHPEIALLLVNGESVGFDRAIRGGDHIAAYPEFTTLAITPISRVRPPDLPAMRFVLDVHLGRLARLLRLLGFDALYRNDCDDGELARISMEEQRILLSQDRGLLKRRQVRHAHLVRASRPEAQLEEVLLRYRLHGAIRPFRRCPRCNGELRPVSREEVKDRLPLHTRESYTHFTRCESCGQIYWRGAHHRRLRALLEQVGAFSPAPPPDRESRADGDGGDCRNAPVRSPSAPPRRDPHHRD